MRNLSQAYAELNTFLNTVQHDSIISAMSETYEKSLEEYKYYWVDLEGNPGVYADLEKEYSS